MPGRARGAPLRSVPRPILRQGPPAASTGASADVQIPSHMPSSLPCILDASRQSMQIQVSPQGPVVFGVNNRYHFTDMVEQKADGESKNASSTFFLMILAHHKPSTAACPSSPICVTFSHKLPPQWDMPSKGQQLQLNHLDPTWGP